MQQFIDLKKKFFGAKHFQKNSYCLYKYPFHFNSKRIAIACTSIYFILFLKE